MRASSAHSVSLPVAGLQTGGAASGQATPRGLAAEPLYRPRVRRARRGVVPRSSTPRFTVAVSGAHLLVEDPDECDARFGQNPAVENAARCSASAPRRAAATGPAASASCTVAHRSQSPMAPSYSDRAGHLQRLSPALTLARQVASCRGSWCHHPRRAAQKTGRAAAFGVGTRARRPRW